MMRSFLTFPRATVALAPSDPFRAMERKVERLFGDGWPAEARGAQTSPRLDVKETDKALVVTAELPGVDEKDVEVELTGRTLVLRGEKKQETDTDEKGYHLMERTYGSFLRSLQLPYEADAAKVEASFARGVLTVTVPKPDTVLGAVRKVAIKSAEGGNAG